MLPARSIEDVLGDVIQLAVEYYLLTGKPLGVTGEIAEYMASSVLNLELAPARSEGFDAIRRRGQLEQKIQIKGRFKHTGKDWGRVSSINTKKEFDTVMLVLMRGHYELFEIWEADRDSVIERLTRPGSKSRNERGSMGVPQFKSIAKRVWPSVL